jgi:hypothetical protein
MNGLKKRVISGVVCAAIVCGCLTASGFSAVAAGIKYGDVNNDGKINSLDALEILTYSVGSKTLDSDSLKRADVTGDGKVNSSDALDILRYVVGLISSFKAENTTPASKNDILNIYSQAISKARSTRPSYKIDSITETKNVDVQLSGAPILLIGSEKKAEMEQQAEKEATQRNVYSTIVKQNSTNSLNNLPAECKLTDASLLKSITVAKEANGNYKIDITFNDEINPKVASSTLVKVLGVADYDATLTAFKENSSVEGATVSVDSLNMRYSGCWLSCEVNPNTNEFVSLHWYTECDVSISVSVMGVTSKMSMTNTTDSAYSNFGY